MARLSFRSSLVSALALTLSAGLASAADMPAPEAQVFSQVPASNWSGFYAGSVFGYGFTTFDATSTLGGGSSEGDVDGATGGALIGYNWQSGDIVFGLEGDLTLHEIRGDLPGGVGIQDLTADTLWSAHARGRVGYDFGRFLPYVAGGFTANEVYARSSGNVFGGENQRLVGWNVGAGVDFHLGQTWIGPITLRAGYLYENVSEELFDNIGAGPEISQETHFARVAIISRLGEDSTDSFSSPAGDVDWSGAYGGLMAGYGWLNAETTSPDLETDGALGGIYTGRNFQFGKFVVGFDADILLTDFEGSGAQPGAADVDIRNYIQGDARGRLGYAVGRFLPYVAGGLSWTRTEQIDTATGAQRGRVPAKLWTVGAGVDYRVADHFSVRAEYIHGESYSATSPNLGGAYDQDITFDEVRFGTAYHF